MAAPAIQVAVPTPLHGLFDYRRAPDSELQPGCRVRVPFGRRQLVGIVMGLTDSELPTSKLRMHGEVLDQEPFLPADVLALAQWAARYYQEPIGQVLAACVPTGLRQGRAVGAREETWLRITPAGTEALKYLPSRAVAQRRLLENLQAGPQPQAGLASAALRRLLEQGWVERYLAPAEPMALREPPPLTDAQQQVLDALLAQQGFQATLLEGVTGSGKTEVYSAWIDELLAQQRQVLVLAPEIGLTPQLVARLQARFGASVGAYHSGLTEAERARSWQAARRGELQILVGTRSAVFTPLPKLGAIIVDEEHDPSYKQQEGFRYHARDLAILRAQHRDVPVLLGTATPALETLHNVRAGRYAHLSLAQRANRRPPPAVATIDLRRQKLEEGVSGLLFERIDAHLAEGGQALLFINRRGFAPVLLCHDCGWIAPCRSCDARMTLHRGRSRLICHHCGSEQPVPSRCPSCHTEQPLLAVGQGTERIEAVLQQRYPDKRVERLDSDRLRKAGELERLLGDARSGAIDILVGTQILAKGHDFAGLSLVGIINVDQALFGSDFRALERMGQMVTQVAGRAGRGERPGEVLLQTHQPEHPMLRTLVERGYGALCEALLAERQMGSLPPFAHLALLRAEAPQLGNALQFLQDAAAGLDRQAVQVMGPIPAPMERVAGRSRAQLLLRSDSRSRLQGALTGWAAQLAELPSARRVRWSLDVDPVDLF